jgi:hypothetical protein
LALAGALAMLGYYSWVIRRWMLDDAFISFRYAENFADGHGLVYNVGERVEGYTTFLWVFVLGLGHKLGFDTVQLSRWLGMTLSVASFGLLGMSGRFLRTSDASVAAISILLLGSCATFTTWGMSGMEVPLVALLGLATALVYLRAASDRDARLMVGAGVLSALAAMTRPDAGLLFVTFFCDQLIDRWRSGGEGRGSSLWLRFGLGFGVVYLPYFVWRYLYYGWLLPNTFYAKVGSTSAQVIRGADYFTRWGGATLPIAAMAIAGVLAISIVIRRYGPIQSIPAYLGLHSLYVISVGGDSQPAFRFFGEIMPLLCLFAAMSLVTLVRSPAKLTMVTLVAVGFNLFQIAYRPEMLPFVRSDRVAERGKLAGDWLRENIDPEWVISTNTAGSIPYHSRLRAIDSLGLNDAHIAHREMEKMGKGIAGHEKGDGEYILSRAPELIMFDSATGSRKPRRPSDELLWKNEEFHRLYGFHSFAVGEGRRLNIYLRKTEDELAEEAAAAARSPQADPETAAADTPVSGAEAEP